MAAVLEKGQSQLDWLWVNYSEIEPSDIVLTEQLESLETELRELIESISKYTGGDGIDIDEDNIVSIDGEYLTDYVLDTIDDNLLSEEDIDSIIMEVEDETEYGMAEAMGVE